MTHEIQPRINAYWNDRAPDYHAYQQRPERRDLDRAAWARVWSSVLPPAPADVLDVGTGSGHVACLLAGLGHRVTGIDAAPRMVSVGQTHAARLVEDGELSAAPRLMVADAVQPPFEPATFDAVVGRYVMWTLRDPDAAVAHWIRLLRPGGVVAMADSTWFADGMDASLYGERPEASLPLAGATSIEATAQVLRDAGMADVRVVELEEILALDRQHGVAPGHDVQLQYLVTGRRP